MKLDLAHLEKQAPPSYEMMSAKKAGYRDVVPIHEGAEALEPLVDVRGLGIAGVNIYNTPYNPPYFEKVPGSIPELFLRQDVADRLVAINGVLQPHGLELYLFDGWRPQAIQRHFHDVWFPNWLRTHRPDIPESELMEEVERYWSAPTLTQASPSPHSTGGAVDLTLQYLTTKQPLYMGGIFDDLTDNAHTDWFERFDPISMSDTEARKNRRLLFNVMSQAGFANNPTEWWHYSIGDQMWAKLLDKDAAYYPATEPE